MDKRDSDLIDMLGGTKAVAELCRVRPPSVSEWRRNGIPAARRMYLELLRPDVFQRGHRHAPTATREAA